MVFTQEWSAHDSLHAAFFCYGEQEVLLPFGYVRKQTGISWSLFLYDIINGLCQGLSITGNQLPETNNFANPLQRYCFFLICARVLKKKYAEYRRI